MRYSYTISFSKVTLRTMKTNLFISFIFWLIIQSFCTDLDPLPPFLVDTEPVTEIWQVPNAFRDVIRHKILSASTPSLCQEDLYTIVSLNNPPLLQLTLQQRQFLIPAFLKRKVLAFALLIAHYNGFHEGIELLQNYQIRLNDSFIGNYPELFTGVRGKGLMLGLMMTHETRAFVAHLRDNHGLLTVAAGDNTLRVLPPLNIEQAHIDEFVEKLSAGAASYQMPVAA